MQTDQPRTAGLPTLPQPLRQGRVRLAVAAAQLAVLFAVGVGASFTASEPPTNRPIVQRVIVSRSGWVQLAHTSPCVLRPQPGRPTLVAAGAHP